MLGSGVITVSAVPETAKETTTTWGINHPVVLQRRVQLKRQPSHMYYQLKPSKIFDCNAFFNEEGFTINYDEEHILLPNCHLMIYHAFINDGPVTVDTNNVPIYMCFKIRLTTPGMSLNVGKHTPLNLLLHCAQLDIVQLGLTSKQVVEMREPYNNAAAAANAVNSTKKSYQQSAAKKPRQDIPPLPVSQIPLPPPPPPPTQLERPTCLNFNSSELSPA
jgi:hypothetical protein